MARWCDRGNEKRGGEDVLDVAAAAFIPGPGCGAALRATTPLESLRIISRRAWAVAGFSRSVAA